MVGYVEMVEGGEEFQLRGKLCIRVWQLKNMNLEFKWGNLGNATVKK